MENFSINYNLSELNAVSKQLLNTFLQYDIWLLEGDMGVGKTTLIKELVATIGSEDEVSSPTFSLVNEYKVADKEYGYERVYHFDLYRLKSVEELYDIGIDEYLADDRALCLIEWPEKALHFIEKPYLAINLFLSSEEQRQLQAIPSQP